MIIMAMALAAGAAPPEQKTCPVLEASVLVHKIARRDNVVKEAREIAGGHPLRWIVPGTMTTQDYVPLRLNIVVGVNGRIAWVWCG